MGPADEFQSVCFGEVVDRRLSKNVPRASGGLVEAVHVVRVGPQEVEEGSGRGDLLGSRDGADLLVRPRDGVPGRWC